MTFTPYTADPELDLVLEREVPVAPEVVFRAWTEPELLCQFFTPKPWETPIAEIDARPGGIFRTVMRSPEGEEFDSSGCFLDVIPNERIVWTSTLGPGYRPNAPEEGDLAMTAILELTPHGDDGCRYRAIAMHADVDTTARHSEMGFHDGWGTVVDQMVELLQNQA